MHVVSQTFQVFLIIGLGLRLFYGSGYFAVDGNLPSETILP